MIRSSLAILLTLALSLAALGACQSKQRHAQLEPGERDLAKATQLVRQADNLRQEKKYADAVERYKEALVAYDELPNAWHNMGICLVELNDYFAAQQAYIRASELSPRDPRIPEAIALLYQDRLQDDVAMEYFLRSLDLNPNYLPSIRGVVKSARHLGRSDERTRDIIRRGLLLEHDSEWIKRMQTERIRVEQDLAAMGNSGNPSFGSGTAR